MQEMEASKATYDSMEKARRFSARNNCVSTLNTSLTLGAFSVMECLREPRRASPGSTGEFHSLLAALQNIREETLSERSSSESLL